MSDLPDGARSRRDFLATLGAALGAAALLGAPLGSAAAARPPRRRLLCFTKSSGFEHSVIKRGADGSPSLVERVLTEMGTQHGFDVTCTKDGTVFASDRIKDVDAFFFFTSGYLTDVGTDKQPAMTDAGKQALLGAIRGGKGFVGFHSASDSFHTLPDPTDRSNRYVAHGAATDPYLKMLGGEFILHGQQQKARMRVVDSHFPGMEGYGAETVERMGEWYSLKDFTPDLHVLSVVDTDGMTGAPYQRGPYPVTWARREGRGRVFFSALGHREEEWQETAMPTMVLGALRWAFGDVKADVAPNLSQAAPRAADIPPKG
ncbi:MAG: ThuA domain-containing protein [Gemmatirosa sp.]|nr:ThuA domain-containing protein [Gemmatirosa sp.]